MAEENERVFLVGMDGSEESAHALQWALRHLCTQHDRIIIIHVQSTVSFMTKTLAGYSRKYSSKLKATEDDIKRFMGKIYAGAVKECTEKRVVPEIKIMTGDAGDALCKAVKEYNADILFLGSHGNGPIKRWLCCSVIDHCVHNAQCPVVVVKNQKKQSSLISRY